MNERPIKKEGKIPEVSENAQEAVRTENKSKNAPIDLLKIKPIRSIAK